MKKRGIMWNTIVPWLIGLAILIIIIILAVVLKDKLFEFGKYIKDLFR